MSVQSTPLPGERLVPKVRRARAGLAPRMVRAALRAAADEWRGGRLVIRFPDGETLSLEGDGGAGAEVIVRDLAFMRRVLASGDIGFAEGYVAGEWTSPDLPALLQVLSDNFDTLQRLARGGPLMRAANRVWGLFRRNTREGSKRNIEAHYDLGNDFYAAWLDPGMTYSAALYEGAGATLCDAQAAKYRALAQALDLGPGQTVLEIGCGWGGFAEFAAREYGCHVTGVTISPAQHAYARARIERAGLSERVDIRLADYRDVEGSFDRIVSIEMFEAVGEAWWPAYFDTVRARLNPGGRAGLQIITIREDLFERYRTRIDFVQKHVFPGGMLPNEGRLRQEVARAGLTWGGVRRFGRDYARTLGEWSGRFESAWPALARQGFDDRFRRLWQFYLAYCQAGFATGRTDVIQLTLDQG